MRKIFFTWVLGIFNVSVCALSIWFYARGSLAPVNVTNDIEYKDLISILLTALGVMIAVGAIVLAVAAIWGYNSLKEETVRAATRTAKRISREVAREIAGSIAREVASATSARELRSGNIPVGTPADEAQNIATAMDGEAHDGDLNDGHVGEEPANGERDE